MLPLDFFDTSVDNYSMYEKKDKTREFILQSCYSLFAQKGFKQVTMKDVCEITKLSRGGLYSHFASTAQIFEDILKRITSRNTLDFEQEMSKKTPAPAILKNAFAELEKEMSSLSESLSVAIFEYSQIVDSNIIQILNKKAEEKWAALFKYGIKRGEFVRVDVPALVNTLLYAYQGIRMWQTIIPMKPETAKSILKNIQNQLIGESK